MLGKIGSDVPLGNAVASDGFKPGYGRWSWAMEDGDAGGVRGVTQGMKVDTVSDELLSALVPITLLSFWRVWKVKICQDWRWSFVVRWIMRYE